MAQFLRPIQDSIREVASARTADGTSGITTNLWNVLDELVPSDTDFVYGGASSVVGNTVYQALLSTGTNPLTTSNHILRYRLGKGTSTRINAADGAAVSATISLRQGGVVIATDTAKTLGLWTTYEFLLTNAQASAITNYGDLRVQINTIGAGSSPNNRMAMFSFAELQIPDVQVNTKKDSGFFSI